ncbi:MAG: hypothetical protein IJV02_00085 [Candidatus Methanomethylophilaceae archaeon]|nr:hypothetical protein [Candidatus Methanomethylophilaceae archaeon]MBR1452525.1 hypothetical protein [Candidatus Methanomethylophilaceae archaeon]
MGEATLSQIRSAMLAYVDTARTKQEVMDRFASEAVTPYLFEDLVKKREIVLEPGSNGKRWTTRMKAKAREAVMEGSE